MDSLTQIVLGAAVGEALLGNKVGRKAMLYGAIAGTIPDLDVLSSYFTDTVTALEIHRGFTHSIVFSIVFGLFSGWFISLFEKQADWKSWSLLMFAALVTHPLLDAHTTWGTQLFWPLDLRLAYKNIFVIDPLYTLPFLVCLLIALFSKNGSVKRQKYNQLGLTISSIYLIITIILKGISYYQFKNALDDQHIAYTQIETKPTPFNTILWTANIDTKDHYLIGYYSFFDQQPITFKAFSKNHFLIDSLKNDYNLKRMIHISKGWYTIEKEGDHLLFNDLRFGILDIDSNRSKFAFSYRILKNESNESLIFEEVPKDRADAQLMLQHLWHRIKGN